MSGKVREGEIEKVLYCEYYCTVDFDGRQMSLSPSFFLSVRRVLVQSHSATRDTMFHLAFLLSILSGAHCNWEGWWTYDGISGPNYWGVINPAWWLCSHGKLQSPIDIDPSTLVYDKSLLPIAIDKKPVPGGILENTGQSLVFRLNNGAQRGVNGRRRALQQSGGGGGAGQTPVNITGGSLAYRCEN